MHNNATLHVVHMQLATQLSELLSYHTFLDWQAAPLPPPTHIEQQTSQSRRVCICEGGPNELEAARKRVALSKISM